MNLFIDLHIVVNILAIVVVMALCVLWALFSRRVVGFLVLFGLCMTLMVADRSDLVPAHLAAIGIVGVVLTALLVLGYILVLASLRGRRFRPSRARRHTALQFAPAEQDRVRHPRVRPSRELPVAEPYEREVPEVVYEEEVPEIEVRRPVRHSAASRSRYVVNPRGQSRAHGARLQREEAR